MFCEFLGERSPSCGQGIHSVIYRDLPFLLAQEVIDVFSALFEDLLS